MSLSFSSSSSGLVVGEAEAAEAALPVEAVRLREGLLQGRRGVRRVQVEQVHALAVKIKKCTVKIKYIWSKYGPRKWSSGQGAVRGGKRGVRRVQGTEARALAVHT